MLHSTRLYSTRLLADIYAFNMFPYLADPQFITIPGCYCVSDALRPFLCGIVPYLSKDANDYHAC